MMNLKAKPVKWQNFRIRYELQRRGLSVKQLSTQSGFSPASIRMAFVRPATKVNTYIAKAINVPLHELWPDWFDNDGDLIPAKYRRKLSRQRQTLASHESLSA